MTTVKQLAEKCGFTEICLPDGERAVEGCYMGDLLSWVMGRAEQDNVWITIMSNANIVAVASLADVACIILAEGVELDGDIIKTANEKGVNILSSDLPQYETAICMHKAIQA